MEKAVKTIKALENVPQLLYDAFEVGAQNVQEYFKNKKTDSFLSPNIMRFVVKSYIKDSLWKVSGLKVKDVPNNGIYLLYKNYHIRVWKHSTRYNELPTTGGSYAKDNFLRQQISFPFSSEEKPINNLVVLWETDSQYQLKGLRLSQPRKCTILEAIKAEWSVGLDHPVITKDRLTIPDEVPIYDLPLELLEQIPVDESDDDILPESKNNDKEPDKGEEINGRAD